MRLSQSGAYYQSYITTSSNCKGYVDKLMRGDASGRVDGSPDGFDMASPLDSGHGRELDLRVIGFG